MAQLAPLVVTVGWSCLDQRYSVAHFPPSHSRTPVTAYREALGGPATVAAQAIVRLGGRARLVSRRGDDPAGHALEARIRAEGIEPMLALGQRTPVSAVLVTPQAERYIFPYRGELPAQFEQEPDRVLEGAGALLLDHRWPQASLPLARRARQLGLPVVLDLDHDRPEAWALVPHCTHVVASGELAEELGGVQVLLDRLPVWAAVTLGADGVGHREGRIPAFRVKATDSTGAGDVYHGAFALALAEAQPPIQALRFAAAVAALHVQQGQPPTRGPVEQLLAHPDQDS